MALEIQTSKMLWTIFQSQVIIFSWVSLFNSFKIESIIWGPILDATDCPKQYQEFAALNDELKSMTNIKPAVLHDVDAIIEKFSCNPYVSVFLKDFVNILFREIISDFSSTSANWNRFSILF